jgi:hypothetical protein
MIVANFALCLLLSKSELRFKKGHFVFPQQKKYARQQNKKKAFFYRFYKIPSPSLFVSYKSLMNLCWLDLSG